MIYTIGHEELYLSLYNTNGKVIKVGRRGPSEEHPDGYPGGYAFLSHDDALTRINEAYPNDGFCVFGLNAKWGIDTEKNKDGGWWHDLINDSHVVILDNGGVK